MHATARRFTLLGAVLAAAAVAAGAFGAHGLRNTLSPAALETFATAARYQMYHALALILLGALWTPLAASGERLLRAAGWSFVAGILLFSGSLYLLALAGLPKLGMIAPLGGLCYVVGWMALTLAAYRARA